MGDERGAKDSLGPEPHPVGVPLWLGGLLGCHLVEGKELSLGVPSWLGASRPSVETRSLVSIAWAARGCQWGCVLLSLTGICFQAISWGKKMVVSWEGDPDLNP